MKKILLFGFVVLIGTALALSAQDLGELAKKEKEKREALQKEGKAPKVLTNEDIQNMKTSQKTAASSTDSDQPVSESDLEQKLSDAQQESTEAEQEISGGAVSPDEVQGSEEYQEQQSSSVDEQLKQLQDAKDAAENKVNEAKKAVDDGGLLHTYAIGNQFKDQREGTKEIKEINKQEKQLKQDTSKDNATPPQQNPDENQPQDENSEPQ